MSRTRTSPQAHRNWLKPALDGRHAPTPAGSSQSSGSSQLRELYLQTQPFTQDEPTLVDHAETKRETPMINTEIWTLIPVADWPPMSRVPAGGGCRSCSS